MAARAAGVCVMLDGGDLALEASAPPPAAVLDLLSRHKAEIVALLRRADDGWLAEEWRAFFDERAGIDEFDGRLPRPDAEARAFACCVAEWLSRHPACSTPECCLVCGGRGLPHEPPLPHGVAGAGHAWVHPGCCPGWQSGRKAEAVAALAAMGIDRPPGLPDDFGKNGGA